MSGIISYGSGCKTKEQYKIDQTCFAKMNENEIKLNQNKREHIQLIS